MAHSSDAPRGPGLSQECSLGFFHDWQELTNLEPSRANLGLHEQEAESGGRAGQQGTVMWASGACTPGG